MGTVDEDANPPMSDPTESETYGGTGELTPQDTGSAMPPYEGRKEAGARVAVPTQNLSATHWRPSCGLCRKAQDSRLAITVPATGVDADRVRPDHRRHQKLKISSDRFAASRFGSMLGGRGLTPRATVRRSRGNA